MVQENKGLARRQFLGKVGKIGVASAVLGAPGTMGFILPDTVSAEAEKKKDDHNTKKPGKNSSYMLLNVRLESGYKYDNGQVVGTETVMRNLQIEKGIITKILDTKAPYKKGIDCYDAKGLLLLPSFKDMHIHLDKTYYGGPWRAAYPRKNVFDIINLEQTLLLELLPTAQERAEKLIELILSFGSTYIRNHCNIDQVVGLKNLEKLKLALANYSDKISHEIVAFPQHGLLRSNVEGLMREAMQLGVTHVGGLDPTLVDGDIEKSLQTMVQIAVDYKAGIDIHLHEGGEMGLKVIRRLADLTEEAKLQGKVTISHAFSLASLPDGADVEMANRLASLDISIASSVPIMKQNVMPISLLQKQKVNVLLGTDNIMDHWLPFGIGDTLQKAHLVAQQSGRIDEYNLSRTLSLATGGITPLDDSGKQIWPQVGDAATAVLVPASCSAEAVARLPKRTAVLHKGTLCSGSLDSV
ncbi:amidohydrolase [Ammoniphilus sp. 3BR4]|uniref:amidohydrolase n=1 Tax=Ammoniphilus sp. 3BR4 TaxID=3158265 RepID=UPI003465801D